MKDDKAFIDDLRDALPSVAVPAGLEARILADFDRLAVRRRSRLAGVFQAFADSLWPGAPFWQPAALLATSLMIGLAAGAFVPAQTSASAAAASDQTLVASDTPLAMDLYKDL